MVKGALSKEPVSIARVSLFQGDLETTIKRFSKDFFRKPDSKPRVVYGLLYPGENPYIMNLTYSNRQLVPPENYNTLLLITSRSDERNQEVLEEFQHKTGMDFSRPAPEKTKLHIEVYDAMLSLLETNPNETIDFLRKLISQPS